MCRKYNESREFALASQSRTQILLSTKPGSTANLGTGALDIKREKVINYYLS